MKLDITALIRELLFGHDCVVIPGFGGFIGNYNPARIDKSTGTFYPPVRKISYNRNLDHNDGLLMKKVSSVAGISYSEAGLIVGEFVAGICMKLEKGEKVVFDRIGTFSTNQEGNIQFEPDSEVNYFSDSYGLETFRYLPVEGYDVRKRIIGESGHSERRYALRKYLWRAAVILPLAGVLVAVSVRTDLFKGSVGKATLNPLASAEFEHNRTVVDEENARMQPIVPIEAETATSASSNTEEQISAPVADASQPVAMVPEPVVRPAEPAIKNTAIENGYYIVTGSFQSEENAMIQVSQLKAAGYNPEVTSSGKGFYRVSAMLCPDLGTAMKEKDSVALKFPGAWVARKK